MVFPKLSHPKISKMMDAPGRMYRSGIYCCHSEPSGSNWYANHADTEKVTSSPLTVACLPSSSPSNSSCNSSHGPFSTVSFCIHKYASEVVKDLQISGSSAHQFSVTKDAKTPSERARYTSLPSLSLLLLKSLSETFKQSAFSEESSSSPIMFR